MRIKDSRLFKLEQLNLIADKCSRARFIEPLRYTEFPQSKVEGRRTALAGTIYAVSELGCILGLPLGPLGSIDFLTVEFALGIVYTETSIHAESEDFLHNQSLKEILNFVDQYNRSEDPPDEIMIAVKKIQDRVSQNIAISQKSLP